MRLFLVLALVTLPLAACGGTDWSDRWRDAKGNQVRAHVVSTGTVECVDDVVVLYLGSPLGTPTSFKSGKGREYARNPEGNVDTVQPFQENVHLPSTAHDTGYRLGEIELWIAGNARDGVFIVDGDNVELWPRLADLIGCA